MKRITAISKCVLTRFLFTALVLLVAQFERDAAADSVSFVSGVGSDDLTCIMRDATRDLIYVCDSANSQLVIIDPVTLFTSTIALPGRPHWAALRKDNTLLGVAIDAATVALINPDNNSVVSSVQFSKNVHTFDFDDTGKIYFSTSDTFGSIWYGNPADGSATASFTNASHTGFFADGLVRTDAAGTTVFIADGPGGMTKAVVSNGVASSVMASTGALTGITDFRIGVKLYVATTIPSGISIVDLSTMAPATVYQTQDTPVGVELANQESRVFTIAKTSITRPDYYSFIIPSGNVTTSQSLRRPGIFFSTPREKGLTLTADGRLGFYIEGYDGTLDQTQKGYAVGIIGAIPSAPSPSVVSKTVSVKRLPAKGGKIDVSLVVQYPSLISSVKLNSVCKPKKGKSLSFKAVTTQSELTRTTATYSGTLSVSKKARGYACTVNALLTETSGRIRLPLALGRVTVAAK